jgi:hypothetical protein
MLDPLTSPLLRRLILGALLGGLVLLSWLVLAPFVVPVLWAAIFAYVSWPVFLRLERWFRSRHLAATVMTLLIAAAVVLPLLWLVLTLQRELGGAWQQFVARAAAGQLTLPESVYHWPVVGPRLQELLEAVRRDPSALGTALSEMATRLFGEMGGVMGGVGRNLAKMGFAVLALFFLYLSGEDLLRQVRLAARGLLGARVEGYVEAIGATTRAVVYGLVLTALAQGVMAGIGYAAVGFSAPLLLGALTVLIALIPFGTPFVWGSLALWLVLTGETGKGLALFLWGAVVVSWVDNLVRPLVISSATRIPFLLVMFGVLGGVAAFGLIGLFLGPVVLAVALAVWREWLEEQGETDPAS